MPFDRRRYFQGWDFVFDHWSGQHGCASPPLELIPLGGLGEFGMNMMLVACGDTAILVDAGVMFPEPDLLGVDLIIPDVRQLLQRYRIQALVLTHGHEDHIGAVPHVVSTFRRPDLRHEADARVPGAEAGGARRGGPRAG